MNTISVRLLGRPFQWDAVTTMSEIRILSRSSSADPTSTSPTMMVGCSADSTDPAASSGPVDGAVMTVSPVAEDSPPPSPPLPKTTPCTWQ